MSGLLLVATPTFATHENLIRVCYSFSVIGIATIGMLLVFAAGDIDFSIGAPAEHSPHMTRSPDRRLEHPGRLSDFVGVAQKRC